jgi:tetratricopeptide (TPR) repeat protein
MNGRLLIAIAAVTTAALAQQRPAAAPLAPAPPVLPAAPLQGPQAPQAPQAAPFDVFVDQERVQAQMERSQEALSRAQKALEKTQFRTVMSGDIAGVMNNAFDVFNYAGLSFQGKISTSRLDGEYENGTRALDDRRYDDAIRRFNAVIDGKAPRADGALYWKAYALNRVGRKDDALAAIAQLRRDYAGSHWLNDAQALEVEIKQSSGQPVSPEQESNEDLKLMALNSLMSADPDRAIASIEGILKGNSSPKVKDRALFVLTQNRSARAQQILSDYAKGAGNPDLQIRAIRYIGMSGTPNVAQQLGGYYTASNDVAVKKQIIQALMMAQGKDALFNLAKTEKDESLRSDAIRQLGAMRATDQLGQLYASETSPENKVEIVRSLFVAGASDKLLDLAKTEKDQKVRDEAIRSYARTRSATPEALASLYTMETDSSAKRSIVNGIFERGDAKLLIDLARKESDPAMKQYIVQRLGNMRGNKDATDYMIELLK